MHSRWLLSNDLSCRSRQAHCKAHLLPASASYSTMPASAAEPGILSTAMQGIDSFAQLTGLPWWAVIPLTALGWLCASGSRGVHVMLQRMPVPLSAAACCTYMGCSQTRSCRHNDMPDMAHSRPLQTCCSAWHKVELGRSMAPLAAWLSSQPTLPIPASGRNVQAATTAAGVRGVLFPLSVKQTQASLSLTQMMGQVTLAGRA